MLTEEDYSSSVHREGALFTKAEAVITDDAVLFTPEDNLFSLRTDQCSQRRNSVYRVRPAFTAEPIRQGTVMYCIGHGLFLLPVTKCSET